MRLNVARFIVVAPEIECIIPFQPINVSQVYLHVDLTYYPAVRMYETMGYEVVNDLEISFEVRTMLRWYAPLPKGLFLVHV